MAAVPANAGRAPNQPMCMIRTAPRSLSRQQLATISQERSAALHSGHRAVESANAAAPRSDSAEGWIPRPGRSIPAANAAALRKTGWMRRARPSSVAIPTIAIMETRAPSGATGSRPSERFKENDSDTSASTRLPNHDESTTCRSSEQARAAKTAPSTGASAARARIRPSTDRQTGSPASCAPLSISAQRAGAASTITTEPRRSAILGGPAEAYGTPSHGARRGIPSRLRKSVRS